MTNEAATAESAAPANTTATPTAPTPARTARPRPVAAAPNEPTPQPTPAGDDANEVIMGVAEGVEDDLGDVSFDPEEFQTGFLEDAEMTIVGFKTQAGGETRPGNDGKDFVTSDNLIIQYRVDNQEGIESTRQYLSLPKTYIGKDGQVHRRAVSASSKYGLFLGALAAVGVAKRADMATRYQYNSLSDLVGLQIHRMMQEYEGGFRNSTIKVEVPMEILGIDNDVRRELNLAPASLKGE